MLNKAFFSTIDVSRQIFFRTTLTFAIVNLKPIVPGHVLIIPARPVPRVADLESSELCDLMSTVQRVGRVIERVYGADGLTIACQDGKAAGQTIPHTHFHVLPRKHRGDRFSTDNDAIYPALERAETALPEELQNLENKRHSAKAGRTSADATGLVHGVEPLRMDAEEDRKPRSLEEMEQEAEWLKGFFEGTNENVESS